MLNLRYLLRQLESFVLCAALGPRQDTCPRRMELLCAQRVLSTDILYLGEASAAAELAEAQVAPGATVFLCNASPAGIPDVSLPGSTLVLFTCPLATLYNTISAATAQLDQWSHAYQELTDHGGGLHTIVALTAELGGAATLLLDQNGRVVAGGGMAQSAYLSGLVAPTGALPMVTTEHLFRGAAPDGRGVYVVPGTGLILYGRRIAHLDEVFGMLIIEGRQDKRELDIHALCDCATECLRRRLLSHDLERLGSSSKLFQQCWDDIVERRLTGSAEIRAALSRIWGTCYWVAVEIRVSYGP